MANEYDFNLYIFGGDCGHEWVGSVIGTFACPICGRYDGDHHLTRMEPIAAQVEDLGGSWAPLAAASAELSAKNRAHED